MNCINNSRDVALKELPYLDSQEKDFKKEMDKWYDIICEWVSKNPPTFFVKYLEINENHNSNITSVNYVYFETEDEIHDASIKVVSELYDQ